MLEADDNAVLPDLWPLFAGMASIPLLLIRGELSDLLAMACVERMQEIAPAMQVVQVPRRGHAPMLDEAEAVAAIDAFFATIDGAQPS
jgi:pimeloyl-ACP methyl ester carboxylesterase